MTPHSVGRCRAATEGFGRVSGVGRRLTEGWPFSRKTSVIALSQRLPCVKGDSPRCGEMSRSDRRVRPRKRCLRAAQTEGLSNHIVKPHIFPHAALCNSPKVIQPLDTRYSDMLLYSHRRRIVDIRHIYHQKQKNPKKSCKNLLTNCISCGIIIKLSGERAQGTAQQDLEN